MSSSVRAKGADPATMRLVRGTIPLYRQIANILRAMMRDGLDDATRFTERDLCEKFGVSRTTLRQALQELAADGLVVRVQGKGTSLVPPKTSGGPALRMFGTIEDLIAYGVETAYMLIERGPLPARPDVAELLQLPPGTSAYRFLGMRSTGGAPFALLETWLPYHLGVQITRDLHGNSPIIALIENNLGIYVTEVEQVLTASRAAPLVSESLGLRPGEPTLVIRRVYFAADGLPLGVSTNYCNPERFQYRLRLKRRGSAARSE